MLLNFAIAVSFLGIVIEKNVASSTTPFPAANDQSIHGHGIVDHKKSLPSSPMFCHYFVKAGFHPSGSSASKYSATGWLTVASYNGHNCESYWVMNAFRVNTCFVDKDRGYKYQLVEGLI